MATKTIKIKDMVIGDGSVKTCVPVFGGNAGEVLEHLTETLNYKPDIVEFRADYLGEEYIKDDVIEAARTIRYAAGDVPIIFTFRTADYGGMKDLSNDEYESLIIQIAQSDIVDMVDIDYGNRLYELLPQRFPFIYSYHNVHDSDLSHMDLNLIKNATGTDNAILKISVLTDTDDDLQRLCDFSSELMDLVDTPLIMTGMGRRGADTRIEPQKYGSSIVFLKRGKGTAPGQIDIAEYNKNFL